MLHGRHTLDDAVSVRVSKEARVQIRLGDVVGMRECFLPVGVCLVFPQHADAMRFNKVGVYAFVVDQLDKRAGVDQRPLRGSREHLVGIAVEPLIVEGFSQRGGLLVLKFWNGSAEQD